MASRERAICGGPPACKGATERVEGAGIVEGEVDGVNASGDGSGIRLLNALPDGESAEESAFCKGTGGGGSLGNFDVVCVWRGGGTGLAALLTASISLGGMFEKI